MCNYEIKLLTSLLNIKQGSLILKNVRKQVLGIILLWYKLSKCVTSFLIKFCKPLKGY